MENFLKNIYGILFEPQKTIEELIEKKPVVQAFIIVVLLSVAAFLLSYKIMIPSTLSAIFLVLNIIGIIISSIIFWLVLAAFFEAVSRIFNDESHYKQLLTLMGFSLLPWIFTAPLELLKINTILAAVSSLFEIAIWVWSIVLIFMSVKKLYNLSTKKTWLFFAIPFLGGMVAINWVSQFFAIIVNIF